MHETIGATRFRIEVAEAELADLRQRLAHTRWPKEEPGAPWQHGTSLDYMKQIVAYWRDHYDWRRWEAELNRWPHYHAVLAGHRIHFILERGSGPAPLPLLITHGWPGSVVEFLHIIEPLAHPERFGGDIRDAFTVVAPSLPGYGLSPAPAAPVSSRQVARLWRDLMVDVLGYDRYVAQGGDWGASVTSWLALSHPEKLAAIHLNLMMFIPDTSTGTEPLDDEERSYLAASERRQAGEMAYARIQGTKPQTLSYGLTDSPAGLAAWILEKFHGWTIPGEAASPPFDLDHLLTNLMLYWTNGINAANWLYLATGDRLLRQLEPGQRVTVPTGLLLFPQDILPPPPERWAQRAYNVQHRRVAESGGHFPAMENGPLLVNELQSFFRAYRG